MKQNLTFIVWPAIAGLLAALLILDRWVLPQVPATELANAAPVTYAAAVRAATPSVVNIYTAKLVTESRSPLVDDSGFRTLTRPKPLRQSIERSLGSGVIMTERGHILTNNHVIAGAVAIQVMLQDGRSAKAIVIGTDAATDLAVLQAELSELQPMAPGDSDAIQVGDVVLAIGNPLGFGHSVTQGIVSALGRYGLHLNTYEDYIQTDATIYQGNSGGALIDTQGRLLGINTLIYTPNSATERGTTGIGINLAIPVNLATFVMQDLIEYGEVIRGWLGVVVEPISTIPALGSGRQPLEVKVVAPNSPAQKAGVQVGDIITHIDDEAVQDGRLAMHRIAMLRPGDTVGITLLRGQQSFELRAVLGVLNQSKRNREE